MKVLEVLLTLIALAVVLPVAWIALKFMFGAGAVVVLGSKEVAKTLSNPEVDEHGRRMIDRDQLLGQIGAVLIAALFIGMVVFAIATNQ